MAPLAPPGLDRLSLNQTTTERWGVREAVEGCARAGIGAIGLWRHKVTEFGLAESVKLVRDAGLAVSSLCRGGFFPAARLDARRERAEDNRRAVDEAAELGAEVLVLVCGPAPPGVALAEARAMVADGIEALAPYAAERGVMLGVEPLHPMFCAERSVIVTLAEANALVEALAPGRAGVVVDAYHVWWDPELSAQLERARGRIVAFHVSDWLVPTPDLLQGRGMIGDGVLDLRAMRAEVERAGYSGLIEVEIINPEIWRRPGGELLEQMKERFLAEV